MPLSLRTVATEARSQAMGTAAREALAAVDGESAQMCGDQSANAGMQVKDPKRAQDCIPASQRLGEEEYNVGLDLCGKPAANSETRASVVLIWPRFLYLLQATFEAVYYSICLQHRFPRIVIQAVKHPTGCVSRLNGCTCIQFVVLPVVVISGGLVEWITSIHTMSTCGRRLQDALVID